jgi:hypothetical protein
MERADEPAGICADTTVAEATSSEISVIRFMGVAKLIVIKPSFSLEYYYEIPDRFPRGLSTFHFCEGFKVPLAWLGNAKMLLKIEAKASPEVITRFSGVSNKPHIK